MKGIYFWLYTNRDIFTFLYSFQILRPLQELNPGLQFPKPETYPWAIRLTIICLDKKQGLLGNYLTTQSKNPVHSKKRSLLLGVDHPQQVKIMFGLKWLPDCLLWSMPLNSDTWLTGHKKWHFEWVVFLSHGVKWPLYKLQVVYLVVNTLC